MPLSTTSIYNDDRITNTNTYHTRQINNAAAAAAQIRSWEINVGFREWKPVPLSTPARATAQLQLLQLESRPGRAVMARRSLLVVAGLAAAASAQTLLTKYGPVAGATVDGIAAWHSVPYAAPPVGQRRFAPAVRERRAPRGGRALSWGPCRS